MKHADERPEDEFNRLVKQLATTRAEGRSAREERALGRSLGSGLMGVLQRVVAAMRFDSRGASSATARLRGHVAEARHLLFSAKGRDIDLRLAPATGGYMLSGQVLGPDEGGRVALRAHLRAGAPPPPPTRYAAIDALGEFHLEAIDDGTYVLTLELGHDEIVLPPIEIWDGA